MSDRFIFLRRAAPALLLTAAAVAFHGRVLFSSGHTFPWDFRSHHLPLATAYADALSEGVAPLWEPYAYAGRPLLANPQTAVFYPGMFLAVLPGRGGLEERLEWLAVAHIALAGWLVYLLARRLELSMAASLLSGFMFALGGYPASQAQHLSSLLGMPWLALCWLALLAEARWRFALLALAFALHFLTGFPANTVMVATCTLVFASALAICGRSRRRLPAEVLAAGGLALLLCAVQVLPTWELVQASVGKYRSDWLRGGGGMPPASLVSLFHPNRYGLFDLASFRSTHELTHLYLFSGWSGLLLCLLGLWRLRQPTWRALACTGAVCCVLMLGEFTPAGAVLFRVLPAVLRNTVYWYLFCAPFLLAMSLLAGRGALLWLPCGKWRMAAAALLACECVLVSSGRPMNTAAKDREPLFTEASFEGSQTALSQIRQTAGQARVDSVDYSPHLMTGAPVMRLRVANGYDPLALERLIQVRLRMAKGERWGAYYQVEDPSSAALDALGVRALVTRWALEGTSRWKPAADIPGGHIYVNPDAPPRYRLVSDVRCGHDLQQKVTFAEGFHLEGGTTGTVRLRREDRQLVVLETESAGPSFLATSEVHYPGWSARVDGRPAPIYYTNIAFRGVPVPAGRHRVEFEFDCRMAAIGAGVSILALVGMLALTIRRLYRPNAGRAPEDCPP